MKNVSSANSFINKSVKLPVFEHKAKGLLDPQVKKYTKEEYDKNRISLYEYKEVKLLNPNSEKSDYPKYSGYEFPSVGLVTSNSEKSDYPKYSGYEFPSVGLVAPDEIKVASYGGFYEYPSIGQH